MQHGQEIFKRPTVEPHIRLFVRCDEPKDLVLFDAQNFLYDMNAAYEVFRLMYDPRYGGFGEWEHVLYRDGRPLEAQHRLQLLRLRYESPLIIVTWIKACLEAIIALGKLADLLGQVRRRKTDMPSQSLDAQKDVILRRIAERDRHADALRQMQRGYDEDIHEPSVDRITWPADGNPDAEPGLNRITARLMGSPLTPGAIELEYVTPHRDPLEGQVQSFSADAVAEAGRLLKDRRLPNELASPLHEAVVRLLRQPGIEDLLALRREIGVARRALAATAYPVSSASGSGVPST